MKYDVFVSHASEDRKFVSWLVDQLKTAGLTVWYDQDILKGWKYHGSIIEDGIIQARYMIAVVSKRYLKKDWPEAEFGAIRKLVMHENRERIIVLHHGAPRREFSVPFGRKPVKNTLYSEDGHNFVVAECIRMINEMDSKAHLKNNNEDTSQDKYVYTFPLGKYSYKGGLCPKCGAAVEVGSHSIWCSECDFIDEMEPI